MFSLTKNQRWWVAFNISIGIYMSTLDASIVNIALPTVILSLNTDLKTIAWVVMAYLIVITGNLLLMGRLADLFGQRRVYLFGLFTFTLGSVLCGFSPSIYFLIGSRVIQGVGASATMATGPAIIATTFPEKGRGQALGMVGSVVSAGFITGPLLGGFLVEHVGWRSIFFINLPIGLFGVLLSLRVLDKTRPMERVRVDLWGASFLFFFITTLFLFLNSVSQKSSPFLWVWLVASLIFLGLFMIMESRSPFPLIDLHLLKRRLFISSLGASLLSFWINGAHTFVTPFFLQNILGFPPSKVGMLIFPVALTVMVMAPVGGRISDLVGVRIPATVGLILISMSTFSFIFIETNVSEYQILWRQIAFGVGVGLFNPANNSAIIGSLPKAKVGLASSFLALSRNLGIVIGVAFAEMIIAFGMSSVSLETKGTPLIQSIHYVWKLVLVLGLVAIFISWMRDRRSLAGERMAREGSHFVKHH